MAENMFMDKEDKPDAQKLSKVLGSTYQYWTGLRAYLEETQGPLTEDWKYYNTKSGWTLKLLKKKRNLFFFGAMDGFFRVTFVFGDRSVAVVEKSDLPKSIIKRLVEARKYMEGRGLSVEVHSADDVEHIKTLVKIKIEN